jgi:biopolymer transport protein ExbB/TolQ
MNQVLFVAEIAIMAILLALGATVVWLYWKKQREYQNWGSGSGKWLERGLQSSDIAMREKWSQEAKSGFPSLNARIWIRAQSCQELVPDALDQMLMAELSQCKRKMEKSMAWVGTIGANAPFIGLTGTVLGILGAFREMATNVGGGSSQLMEAISRSLIATAAGLLVAIPAVVCYNLLRQKSNALMEEALELKRILVARSLQATSLAWSENRGTHGIR